jgi:predicted TIM-barrel fold metal-dependent hydrolase
MMIPPSQLHALQAALPDGIVDAHHHLWDLNAGHYPWLQDDYDGDRFFLGPYRALCRDYAVENLRADTAPLRIAVSVHIEAERSRREQVAETRWIADIHRRQGLPSAIVAHVSFLQPDRDAVLAAHASEPLVRGIRSKPVTTAAPGQSVRGQPGTMQDEQWLDGLSKLQDHGFSWDLRVPFWHLAEAADVAAAIPGIPIVLNHCGLPLDRSEDGLRAWRAGMELAASCPHMVVKLSEFGLRGGVWDGATTIRVVREAIAIFGIGRVMYASNLPVSSLSAPVDAIIGAILAGLPNHEPETLQAVFAGNARRFYRL